MSDPIEPSYGDARDFFDGMPNEQLDWEMTSLRLQIEAMEKFVDPMIHHLESLRDELRAAEYVERQRENSA